MEEYDENDLIHQDYQNTTTDGDDPKYIGFRDRVLVNKKETYEVVYFCNSFLQNYQVAKTKESFRNVERLIRLPAASQIVKRDELNKFVAENWK